MVRIIIKGGVWKNTEDEVLKAAIAKYGKNQWARISSLLARWYEWLDPSIKKTEWSKTEDEKLLHLAKLMPTQWRTIAPIVGRTATQCLERYQKLLDEAEAKDNEELGLAGTSDSGPSADDVRRLRPGEIDPDPETKPARPDPIDMDEDEKEMLQKAKRKARERQLEEARRLAVLQKKRELKAAGIMQVRKGMDYNTDVPFEKKAAPGFYDTSEEQARLAAAPEAERKKRQRRNGKDGEGSSSPLATPQIQKLKEAESIGRRRKLVLPTAQVGEAELEDIVKIGHAGESAKALVEGGSDASGKLLSDYEGLENVRMARTPRTAPQEDNIMTEARNLRNMSIAQTPLLGEENTPLHANAGGGTGFESATPRHQVSFTPNPLATPLRADGSDGSATPGGFLVSATPMRTPVRDKLSINADSFTPTANTPRDQRLQTSSAKRVLKDGFRNLPAPENNFELLVPEEDEDPVVNDPLLSEEDAAERDARDARLREEAERKALARRSQVLQRDLPRPANVEVEKLLQRLQVGEQESPAQTLINMELVDLLQHDALTHPIPGTSRTGGTRSIYNMPSDDDIDAAKVLIHLELASAVGYTNASPEQLRDGLLALGKHDAVDETVSWASTRQTLTFNAASKIWLTVVLGGYLSRSQALSKRLTDAFGEIQQTKVDYDSFSHLRVNEMAVGPRRLDALKEEVEKLERREKRLQERYGELEAERREAEERVQAAEERMMDDAEAMNEAQLAAMEEQ
ncbi:pre-mRNA splicing factor component-domain-containing protein [Mycena amicta]|nr:pre-mRNA splicing factor component-domain-containing protein [Mycena amicta]